MSFVLGLWIGMLTGQLAWYLIVHRELSADLEWWMDDADKWFRRAMECEREKR